ncbi:hypothetical protein BIW11_11433 [Tropilaelaps mercedesae]|uniref:Uncharacterized protein n=1 Tax=Tropilaelaps mercedesae TaxID=418985 RepID=A0A1V9XB29_9ACAR|nr:hypothetical protein BIW11_11433 [Tropilaelaps mercedesae]
MAVQAPSGDRKARRGAAKHLTQNRRIRLVRLDNVCSERVDRHTRACVWPPHTSAGQILANKHNVSLYSTASESPMSCNAEVPDGHSENEEHETEHQDTGSEQGEELKALVLKEQHEKEKEKHTVPSAPLSLCVNSAPPTSVASSVHATPVVPPALAALMPALVKKEKTPPPTTRSPPVSRTSPRPRSVHNSTPVQTPPQPVPVLPASFPHALPSHLSLNPAMLFGLSGSVPAQLQPRVRTPPAPAKVRPSTPPGSCNNCSQTAAEQKKIHSVLQKVIADQKAAQQSQLMFQREILAHLNMITYSIQTLAAQFAFSSKSSKDTISNSPHSQDEDVSSMHDGH